jgi:hypothetical protein
VRFYHETFTGVVKHIGSRRFAAWLIRYSFQHAFLSAEIEAKRTATKSTLRVQWHFVVRQFGADWNIQCCQHPVDARRAQES